jgi:hypothetical protein
LAAELKIIVEGARFEVFRGPKASANVFLSKIGTDQEVQVQIPPRSLPYYSRATLFTGFRTFVGI